MKADRLLQKIITLLFGALFFFVPLFFTSVNSELFELNKMYLTYGLTILIVGAWMARMVLQKKFLFKRTPLDFPLLAFLFSQILSTIFSIDPHTSLFGYYSRFNGGLLSLISYLLLYWALVANSEPENIKKFLKISFFSAAIVSIYGILEHFGHSFSCLMFTGKFDAACWVQNVQHRVFATLGQPNWLAAYLAALIPAVLAILLNPKFKVQNAKLQFKIKNFLPIFILLVILYTCLIFTGSRSGFAGLAIGMAIFWLGYFWLNKENLKSLIKPFLILNFALLTFNLLFGTPFPQLNRFVYYKNWTNTPTSTPNTSAGPQLEVGGTESGIIRAIVWKGAFNIFKHYPLLGTGVETFAYSYYNFRPVEHNLVSEWDFLYNKAHNEYLNYLSTTGIVGLGTYLFFIFFFIIWSIRQFLIRQPADNFKFLNWALFCGWLTILITNFWGFSVVLVSLYFYLIPAFIFTLSSPAAQPAKVNLTTGRKIFLVFLLLITSYLLLLVVNLWRADYYYAQGQHLAKINQFSSSYQALDKAVQLFPQEPLFINELSTAASNLAFIAYTQKEATVAATLAQAAINYSNQAVTANPHNLNFWKTRTRVFYTLSSLDKQYLQDAIDSLQQAIKLAPTDPKLLYNLGLLFGQTGQVDQALSTLQQALVLKPNYEDPRNALAIFYEDLGQKDKAVEQLEIILSTKKNDPEIEKRLQKLKSSP